MAAYFIDGLTGLILGFAALLAAIALALAALRNFLDGATGNIATHRTKIGIKLAMATGLVLFGLAITGSLPEPPSLAGDISAAKRVTTPAR